MAILTIDPRKTGGPSLRRAIFERPNRTTFCAQCFFCGRVSMLREPLRSDRKRSCCVPFPWHDRLYRDARQRCDVDLLFVVCVFFVGVCRCFVSLYGVIESDLAVFHSLGMIAFTVMLVSGAMCLGRIVMMLGGFKVCVFCHIHSPCPEFPFLET